MPTTQSLCGSLLPFLLAVTAMAAPADDGLDRANDFHEKIDESVKELDEARKQFEKAAERYHAMLSAKSSKRKDRYEDFDEKTKECEKERKKLEERHEDMNKEAKKFFDAWRKSTKKIEDGALRRRSQERLDRSRDSYEKVSKAYRVVIEHSPPLTKAMRDQIVYLSHDLSDESAASLRGDAVLLQSRVDEMLELIDDARSTASSYMTTLK